ncbi:MAG TPA: DUF1592 domain-containing protein [Acidobacteriota bacterium]|jgi:hypothetical protein|nr:DUF1592 domain-containing protein [Acidobacteriota bacterium]
MRRNLARTLFIALPLVCLAVAASGRQAPSPQNPVAFDKSVQPFFSENCYQCHDEKLKTSSLNLEAYKTRASVTQDREKWERILYKLRTGLMPPKGVPRPDQAEVDAVIRWIDEEFEAADRLIKPDPGRVTAHRLNRTEYNNTVRDLLGVDLRPADGFPQDDSGYGFDNIGDVLSLSPVLMEKYLAAAEKIARTAVFGIELLKPTLVRHPSTERRIVSSATPLLDYDLTGLSLPNALHVTHRFPVDGDYVIRVVLGGVRPAGSEPLQICLWVDGRQIQVQHFDPAGIASFSEDRQDFAGMRPEFRTRISAGDHWIAASLLRLYEGLPLAYGGPNPSKRPVPPPPQFKPPPGLPPERIEEFRKRFEARRSEKVAANDARIGSLEVTGPYSQVKGPSAESLKKIYACGHLDGRHQAGCVGRIVAGLARRAYRRPVTSLEVNQLVKLVSAAQQEGDSFEEGLRVALEAMLVSPRFLFRIEKDSPPATATSVEAAHPISQHELASRLSYFLWSSMPDDELLACADRGILRQPAVLAAQVRRLLEDPKSRALAENFAGQWLELRKLESAKRDRQRFPEFDEYLRMSMRRETEMFFESIVREDRSILDFIDGNYTFLNERLAKLYQIQGIKGPEFRKVVLTDNAQRSGIFTHASILTVSSYATRTSPVLRGKWILDNILNDPPPPPLPDVPNLDETKIGTSASLRQQLEQHRKNPTCAACHGRMDPLGFGLENFDAIGAWRTQDGKFSVDASGTLPDGRSFHGPQELKAIVKNDRDAFAQCLTGKLLTYALGRGLERYDKPTVKKIASAVAANNYHFSSLVLEIVTSLPFQMQRERGGP